MVGDFLRTEVRHVRDQDAELGRTSHRDVVDADAVAGDDETALGTVEGSLGTFAQFVRIASASRASAVSSASLAVSATASSASSSPRIRCSMSSDGHAWSVMSTRKGICSSS